MPPPTLSSQQFVTKWRQSTLKERSAAQEHFIDLCRLVGHPTPAEDDATGERFTFEAGAGQGWADVWKKGFFAWEYKGKHADLDKAYQQLLQYREALQNPPLLVVCDIDHIVIHTNFTNTVKQVHTITLDDLVQPDKLAQLRAVFFEPQAFKAPQTTEQVTEEAAREFARLADLLRKWGHHPQAIAHFLIRLLFCLFAEDVGLLPKNLFTRLVEQARARPDAFQHQLQQLFAAMTGGGWFGVDQIANFDGGLFDDDTVLELGTDALQILHRVTDLDWASIEPSIFGTLFERSLDPSKRSQIGAHYTSREDILLVVEPVLMAPLRRRWQEVQARARDLAAHRDRAKANQRARLQNQLNSLLRGFADEVAAIQVLDPACGSGNFLYVALRRLLDLQKDVFTFAGEIGADPFFPSVTPAQLHGIEINHYAHELAQATVRIGYIQWLRENGFGFPSQPILKPLDTILRMDAILAYDDAGNPVEPQWPPADVIIGNPPFLGGSRIWSELGEQYKDDLFGLYGDRLPASDLVCYWFEKARAMIEVGQVQRAGLLATQGIRGGANRVVLERIKSSGDIFWAESDRDWILEGATVHVSMVGFDGGAELKRVLDGETVSIINPDLTGTSDTTQAEKLPENQHICYIGTKKAGSFDISRELAQAFLASSQNPNRRSNSDVVLPWLNGQMIVQRVPNRWVIFFGEMSQEEASLYEKPFEYVRENVFPVRQKNNEERARVKWWQHRRPALEMRTALAQLNRFIATPRVSKYRLFAWYPPETLPDDGIYVFARDDDYFFGVLHSKAHELWARRTGTQLREAESGFRYTPTTCFAPFPFPWTPGQEPVEDTGVQAIAQAAKELVEKRDAWLNPSDATEAQLKKRTLTNLYNQRPTWLDLAHRKLDAAVFDAYGWPHDLTDEEILSRLLTLNLDQAEARE